jgi:hypothetical protein
VDQSRPAPPGAADPDGVQAALACALLAASVAAAYSLTLSVPFLMDDRLSITDNPSIRRLWPAWGALLPPTEAGVGGRPLLNLSYAVNYALGGTAVAGYHVANILFHMLSTLVLFGTVRRTLRLPALARRFGPEATALALCVAAIWGLHPIQTESITYVSERAESLMGLFYLLTFYCFIRGAQGRARGLWWGASVLSCAAGAATKEVMVTAPFLLLLYDRTFLSGGFRAALSRNGWLYAALVSTLALLVPRLTSLSLGRVVYGVGFGGGVSPWDYARIESRVVAHYLLLPARPGSLVFDYGPCLSFERLPAGPYPILILALLAVAVAAVARRKAAGFAACWFFLILAPTSSFVPIVGQPVAESRMYLPLAGLVCLCALGGFAWLGRRILPVLALVAVLLAGATFLRNGTYLSEAGLWEDTVSKVPWNPRAHGNLGNAYALLPWGSRDAIREFREVLRLAPDYPEGHNNLGVELAKIPGRMDEAIAQYREALRLRPGFADAHSNLGNALRQTPGHADEAVAQYEEALRLDPSLAQAHRGLWLILSGMPGRAAEARRHLEALPPPAISGGTTNPD